MSDVPQLAIDIDVLFDGRDGFGLFVTLEAPSVAFSVANYRHSATHNGLLYTIEDCPCVVRFILFAGGGEDVSDRSSGVHIPGSCIDVYGF